MLLTNGGIKIHKKNDRPKFCFKTAILFYNVYTMDRTTSLN